MAYTYITFAQAKTNLAARLYPSSPFYADSELGVYIIEALRTFNALSNFQRTEFAFNTRTGVTWYDLTDATNLPNTIRAMTAKDSDLISAIQYHLLEPYNVTYPLSWGGSKQFTFLDLLNALSQIRDQILSETSCTLTQSLITAASGRTLLPGNTIDLRRVCWIPNTNALGYTANLLMPADEHSNLSFEPGWPQLSAGTPNVFKQSAQPPPSFDVDVQPAVAGNYDALTVNAGAALSLTSATVLPIPNDWTWVLKWGALATLLNKDSSSRDVYRAKYCLDRFKQGLAALYRAPSILAARIANIPVGIDSVREADCYRANWQGIAGGTPDSVFCAGLNLLALSPIPNSNLISITAGVVENMPVPSADGDYLQVGQDDLEMILGEAQHIATFKCGGWEFSGTMPLHASFVRHCALYNSKLAAMSEFKEILYGKAFQEKVVNPVFSNADPVTIEA